MKTKTLPNKLSALILVALADLKKAERSKKYKVDMGVWHLPNSHCSVCFAGSVMAFSLKTDPKDQIGPEDFDEKTELKLYALNSARIGEFRLAAGYLGKSYRQQEKARSLNRCIAYYSPQNPKPFHSDMRKAARELAEAGL